MPRSPKSNGEGSLLGCLLVGLGMLMVVVGFVVCGYMVATGGLDGKDPLGGDSSSRLPLVLFSVVAVFGGALLAAVGGQVGRSIRRPGGHRAYGYVDIDDDW